MENIESSKPLGKNVQNMTLKGYYQDLPLRSAPRFDFISKVAKKCGVSIQSVRNWCLYGMKPKSYEHVKVLVEMTGIPEEELWKE